jgi:hypothetical protein
MIARDLVAGESTKKSRNKERKYGKDEKRSGMGRAVGSPFPVGKGFPLCLFFRKLDP